MAHLLIIDDEAPIRTSLREILEYEGHRISEAATGMDGVLAATKTKFDGIFCDVKMPQMDGYELLKSVRQLHPNIPVIFLSSKADEQDQIIGFTLGADDYVTKPFSKHLLLFRVAAVLRRHVATDSGSSLKPVTCGPLRIDEDRHLVTWKKAPIDLTVPECLLLLSLARRPGSVKNRQQLMDAAYQEAIYVSDRTIDSHIRNIRQKLKASDPKCDVIATVHGLGYQLKI